MTKIHSFRELVSYSTVTLYRTRLLAFFFGKMYLFRDRFSVKMGKNNSGVLDYVKPTSGTTSFKRKNQYDEYFIF